MEDRAAVGDVLERAARLVEAGLEIDDAADAGGEERSQVPRRDRIWAAHERGDRKLVTLRVQVAAQPECGDRVEGDVDGCEAGRSDDVEMGRDVLARRVDPVDGGELFEEALDGRAGC